MRKIQIILFLIITLTIFISAKDIYHFPLPDDNGLQSREVYLEPLIKTNQNGSKPEPVESENAYDAWLIYFYGEGGGAVFEGGDSLGVWFRPKTECRVKRIEFMWFEWGIYDIGSTFKTYIYDVADSIIVTDSNQVKIAGNGQYDFSLYNQIIPGPSGDLLGEYEFTLYETTFHWPGWTSVNIEYYGDAIDVGKRDFFVTMHFPEENTEDADFYYGPAENLHGLGDYHSFKWYHDGGTYTPGIGNWVSELNYSIRCMVEYYGDSPPFIDHVSAVTTQYYSCDPGPWPVSAEVTDSGSDTFSGAVIKVELIYFSESIVNADTIDITGNKIGDIYSGEIPSFPANTLVYYYIRALDNGDDNPNNSFTHESKTNPKSFWVLDANPEASILVIDDGGTVDADMYKNVLNENGWIYDSWDVDELGSPTLCMLQHYSSLLWLQGQGSGGELHLDSLDVYDVPDYLDAGGNMMLVSADYLGTAHDGDYSGVWKTAVHSFVIEYLKVAEYNSDANQDDDGSSSDSTYKGLNGNFISGFLGDDILLTTPKTKILALDGTDLNWVDELIPKQDIASPFYVYSESEETWITAATMVDSNYKLVFIPWMLEAASDVSQFNQIVENTFRFFGETNQIDEELYSPVNFILKQNYPNPFNATTIIQYKIPVDADVVLNIYNINGQMVDQLVNQHQKEGQYSVDWSSANMPSGIYFYWLQVDNQCQTKKMVVMK